MNYHLNHLRCGVPRDILEVASLLYDSYDGRCKVGCEFRLMLMRDDPVFYVCSGDGCSDGRRAEIFGLTPIGTRISKIEGTSRFQADEFEVEPILASREETNGAVAQVNVALSGK